MPSNPNNKRTILRHANCPRSNDTAFTPLTKPVYANMFHIDIDSVVWLCGYSMVITLLVAL